MESIYEGDFQQEVLVLEQQAAQQAVYNDDRNTAWIHLNKLARDCRKARCSEKRDSLFAWAALELANVSFVLGKGFSELVDLLQEARKAASRTGDRRSTALINLHLARLLYFGEQRQAAMPFFVAGKKEVEAIGDDDILTRAAEFIGLFFFVQGRFKEAIEYFEKAAKSFGAEKGSRVTNPSGPLWLSYCYAFLGQFNRAIGSLDYYRRLAVNSGDKELATTLRAVLGIILLSIRKNREAQFHLSGALMEAQASGNALASYFARGGLAFHHFTEGRLREATYWFQQATDQGEKSGIIHQYASPIVLETLYALHRQGIMNDFPLNFEREYARIMKEPNIHLKGVAMRLKASELAEQGKDLDRACSMLSRSESFLVLSGDPIQLGKTYVETARIHLLLGDENNARQAAIKAMESFGQHFEIFFPQDLKRLVAEKSASSFHLHSAGEELLKTFGEVIFTLAPSTDFETLLARTVRATNRFFGAERGCIFWFSRSNPGKGPLMRGPCNLSRKDIEGESFRPSMVAVLRAYHENKPQITRLSAKSLDPGRIKAFLCVPFEVEGFVRGVLYHDNTYVNDCFDAFSLEQLKNMAQWLTRYIDHIFAFSKKMAEKQAAEQGWEELPGTDRIITRSPVMKKILADADRIAQTDSTVLILGETGVGKELLARRIHAKSPRADSPMIIIDPTVIPENLVESELFGHEKGAFTGADRMKKGRLEFADKGTLFIDEIGEIPRTIQVKLLRAIQEKTMVRVGGNRTIKSDFRLIAATNRDLARETAMGRFRQDLYYRINVIPITVPPLRERKEDIILLAEYFLKRFAVKYNRHGVCLTQEQKKMLCDYHWPGNIRELENIMERAVLLETAGELMLDLPESRSNPPRNPFDDLPTMDELQRRYISFVLKKTGGRIAGPGGAARILGMKRTSLYHRMKRLGMQ